MAQDKVVIQIPSAPHPLVRRAAQALQRGIDRLFGIEPPIRQRAPRRGYVIRLGLTEPAPDDALAQQAYSLTTSEQGPLRVCELRAGSPVAAQWAVHELERQWGVQHLMHRDVLPEPERVSGFHLPDLDLARRPVLETRTFRILNDILNATECWSLAEHERLFDQLVKLRFNAISILTYAHHPWVDWSFRGVRRSEADLCYGFRHPIHARSVGREMLGHGHYTNEALRGCETYRQRIEAGKAFMHGLIAAAHERGLHVIFDHQVTNVPEQIKRHLGRWSEGVRLPRAARTPTHPHSLGLARDGGEMRFGHLMTPLNPVYVEMVESWLRAHLKEYPEIDGLKLQEQEFPASGAGVRRAWRELDRRHGLSRHFSLDDLLEQGRRLKFHSPGRGLLQTQSAIMMIRLMDLIVNEHRVIDRAVKRPIKVYAQIMNHIAMPVAQHVFDPARFELVALVDYTPREVAKKIDALAFAKTSPMKVHLVTTCEDDNVGFFPQVVTTPMHRIVQGMRRHGLAGYSFRHWHVSKLEPTFRYLIDAAWDADATPRRSVEELVEGVCGRRAVRPLMRALAMIEQTLADADRTVPAGFLMPSLLRLRWTEPLPCPKAVFTRLIRRYEEALRPMRRALAVSEPRGRAFVRNMATHVDFSRRYLGVLLLIDEARQCYHAAAAEKQNGRRFDIERHDKLYIECADLLEQATQRLEEALRLWADDAVQDPSDRGTLVGLNVYGLDYLRGKAHEMRLMAEYPIGLVL